MLKGLQNIISLSRLVKQFSMMLFDSFALIGVILVSFAIRLGYWHIPTDDFLWALFFSPLIGIPIFAIFGLYKSILRYIGFQALWSIGKAVTLYSIIWGLVSLLLDIDGIPRSIVFINWMLSIIVIGGVRVFVKWFLTSKNFENNLQKNKVIIYGAGSAGRQLSYALQQSNEYNHVAFIDDNSSMHGSYINGIIVDSFDNLANMIKEKQVTEVLLALPSISKKHRDGIIKRLNNVTVSVRSLPSVSELAQGKVRVEDLRYVSIKDLLGRPSIRANELLLKLKIKDKVVLVTGAGGSIGSELCRQILNLKPKKLILYEISEFSLYLIEQELNKLNMQNVEIYAVLGSIRNKERFEVILKHYSVETIYHAAAYKHVPLVEFNNSEGVLNNIFGTKIVAEAAINAGVETFVLISTDKAVRPTNTMGATKRAAELVLQRLSLQNHSTCFTMVRFGNVLDSSGSVIPLFKQQIKDGGPVTVTDPDMVRYFMTIHEAVELVIQAGSMSTGGDVFVLDMGKSVRINDLAINMIQLSGLQVMDEANPDGDIEIEYIGIRPGEKLFEELLVDENAKKTDNPLIMRAEEIALNSNALYKLLDQLHDAIENVDQEKIRKILIEIVPEFKPQRDIVDLLSK